MRRSDTLIERDCVFLVRRKRGTGKLEVVLNEAWRVESKAWEDSGGKPWMGGVLKVAV